MIRRLLSLATLAVIVIVGWPLAAAQPGVQAALDVLPDPAPLRDGAWRSLLPQLRQDGDGTVGRIIDGDTVELTDGTRVRLIGVDTPEVHGGTDCYGPEASAHTASLLPPGEAVRLERDVETHDRYGRTLAYLHRTRDGLHVNATLVADGVARVATYPPNVAHTDEFHDLEQRARMEGRGLWTACRAEQHQ